MFILNSRFLTQNLTGVQRYGYELFKQLNNVTDTRYLIPDQDINKRYDISKEIKLNKIGQRKGHLWEQLDLPAYLKKNDNPLLLNLCNTAPLFYKNKIVTIHDISFKKGNWHSKSFKAFYNVMIPRILKNSVHVITVSEFSKRDIMEAFGIAENKISVIYNAPFLLSDENPVPPFIKLKKPYILSVGSMDGRKNLKRAVKAFLASKNDDLTMYLIGEYNSNFKHDPELDQLIKDNQNKVSFLGYVTDQQLTYMYKNALCFVYPSLYEGFGLPPVEAMANNCPVIVSNTSSLPEVCGNAALYCDPLDISDIAKKINAMTADAGLRESYIGKRPDKCGKIFLATIRP